VHCVVVRWSSLWSWSHVGGGASCHCGEVVVVVVTRGDAPTVHVEVEYNYHLGRSKAYELSCVAKVREWVLQAF
jgi:hypothetical protein